MIAAVRRLFCFLGAAALVLVLNTQAYSTDTNIAAGDALFSKRTATSGAAEALALYKIAFDGADGAEARWKAARALHWLGDVVATKKREKAAYFEEGLTLAKESVGAAQNKPDPHFWLAALYGSYGELRGVMKSLSILAPLREQLRAINRLDETYQGGAGHRVLGVIDYKVPGFAGGSRKRARASLERALELDPHNPFNQYYMAEFLVESGQKDEAVPFLDSLAKATVSPDVDAPDLARIQSKGDALRKKMKR